MPERESIPPLGGWVYAVAANLGVPQSDLSRARRGRPEAPSRIRRLSLVHGVVAGVMTYAATSLPISGLSAVPYYLAGQPKWFTLLGYPVMAGLVLISWHVGSLRRRLWLLRELRRLHAAAPEGG
jgi:hypothetical protein